MPTKIEKDIVSGTDTTGHEWDGIKELDSPLPKWWIYVFYATIAWSLVYYVLYPAWPGISGYTKGVFGYSQRVEIQERMTAAAARQAPFVNRIRAASLDEIRKTPDLLNFSIAGGRAVFAENCAGCHGAGGAGLKGYPNLADDNWLWGGTLEAIHQTIAYGIRSGHDQARNSEMPRFGADGLLTPAQIDQLTQFVLSLSGKATGPDAAAGAPLFAENCVACHGEKGEGNAEFGAPRLNGNIWLYGGDAASVRQSIHGSRRGVMPAWAGRLDEATVKMLAIYVHALGGGQ